MVSALILLTLLGGLTMIYLAVRLAEYVFDRFQKKDKWQDDDAEYARKKARADWEQIIRNTQGKP